MIKIFHPRGVKELFWKAGRTTESNQLTTKRITIVLRIKRQLLACFCFILKI